MFHMEHSHSLRNALYLGPHGSANFAARATFHVEHRMSHAPCPLADPNTCKYIVGRRLLSHLPLTAWPILQRPTVFQWSYPTGVETWHLINMVLYLQAVGHAY